MKRIARVILVALAVNYVLILASIWLFHDARDVYRYIDVGDRPTTVRAADIPPESSLERIHRFQIRGACPHTSPDWDKATYACAFDDFWNRYTIVHTNGVVTSKYRKPLTGLSDPEVFLSRRQRRQLVIIVTILLVGAVGASVWYLFRRPISAKTRREPSLGSAPKKPADSSSHLRVPDFDYPMGAHPPSPALLGDTSRNAC